MFGRLEAVLDSEIRSLDHPRVALLGFAAAVLALLKRCVEQAHREEAPEFDASTYHLAVDVASDYQGMLIALEPQTWLLWSEAPPERVADCQLHLARCISPSSIATAKRGPKTDKQEGYGDAAIGRKQVSTARVPRSAKPRTP